MPEIILTSVTKRWNKFYAVDNLNLTIGDNSFVTILGPSGCGKTTVLRMIAGLETPTSGKITIGGVTVFDSDTGINVPPNKRRVGFLFQNYALWPNMTVYQNIAFGLSNIKESMPKVDFAARQATALTRVLGCTEEFTAAINEGRDKSGVIDEEKACLYLIDRFDISMPTAKAVMGWKLHQSQNPVAEAKDRVAKLSSELQSIIKKHRDSGVELNEKFELTRGGSVEAEIRKLANEEIDLRVRRVSRVVKIGMFMDRYPSELSGGQQQRVAIARTLAPEPTVLFMDEPLSNLDAKLRLEMRSELQRLHIDTGSTFIYVTHDQMEAMTLATKICLLDNGVLQQYDAPLDVYNKPVNLFVADFVGNPAINFIKAKGQQSQDGKVRLTFFDGKEGVFTPNEPFNLQDWRTDTATDIAATSRNRADKINQDVPFRCHIAQINEEKYNIDSGESVEEDFIIGVRPEFLRLGDGAIEGEIYSAMPTGMETTVRVRVGNYLLTGVAFGGVLYKIGQTTPLNFGGNGILLFDRKSGRLAAQGSLAV